MNLLSSAGQLTSLVTQAAATNPSSSADTSVTSAENEDAVCLVEPMVVAVQAVDNPVGGGDELVMTNHVAVNLQYPHQPQQGLPLSVEVDQHECSFEYVGIEVGIETKFK